MSDDEDPFGSEMPDTGRRAPTTRASWGSECPGCYGLIEIDDPIMLFEEGVWMHEECAISEGGLK